MRRIFSFKPGRAIKDANPQAIGEALDALKDANNGKLTAEIVLEAARNPDSPMHAGFTWDDTEAANLHRLTEARKLIVSIQVFSPEAAQSIPMVVNVRDPDRGRGYYDAAQVLSDEELRVRALVDIRQAIEAVERKYQRYSGLGDIFERAKHLGNSA